MNNQAIDIATNVILAVAVILSVSILVAAIVSVWMLHETDHNNED